MFYFCKTHLFHLAVNKLKRDWVAHLISTKSRLVATLFHKNLNFIASFNLLRVSAEETNGFYNLYASPNSDGTD